MAAFLAERAMVDPLNSWLHFDLLAAHRHLKEKSIHHIEDVETPITSIKSMMTGLEERRLRLPRAIREKFEDILQRILTAVEDEAELQL